jgi:hypothetical protein
VEQTRRQHLDTHKANFQRESGSEIRKKKRGDFGRRALPPSISHCGCFGSACLSPLVWLDWAGPLHADGIESVHIVPCLPETITPTTASYTGPCWLDGTYCGRQSAIQADQSALSHHGGRSRQGQGLPRAGLSCCCTGSLVVSQRLYADATPRVSLLSCDLWRANSS